MVPPPSLPFVSRQEERLLYHLWQTTQVAKSGNQSLSTAQKNKDQIKAVVQTASVMHSLRKCKYVFPCIKKITGRFNSLSISKGRALAAGSSPGSFLHPRGTGGQQNILLLLALQHSRVVRNAEQLGYGAASSTLLPCWDKHSPQKGQPATTKCCFESGGTSPIK